MNNAKKQRKIEWERLEISSRKLEISRENDPDNHDGVITHLEPDILECKVKWALETSL